MGRKKLDKDYLKSRKVMVSFTERELHQLDILAHKIKVRPSTFLRLLCNFEWEKRNYIEFVSFFDSKEM